MEFLELISEFIIGIAWPAAVLCLAFLFRDAIRSFFNAFLILMTQRRVIVGGGRLEVHPISQGETAGPTKIPREGDAADFAPMPENENLLLAAVENWIRELLRTSSDVRQHGPENILVNALATTYTGLAFEQIYIQIFGSQISAIKALQDLGGSGDISNLRTWYNVGEILHPEVYAKYTFEQWRDWLISTGLIAVQDEVVSLTDAGLQFYPYIESRGYSLGTKSG